METPNDPIKVLKDEHERINIFYSFWGRRIHIESNYIEALEGLVFDVPGPAGSLKDALRELNALLRIEIDQRIVTLDRLRDMQIDATQAYGSSRQAYTPARPTPQISWLTPATNDLKRRIDELANRKAQITSLEEAAEKATLPRTSTPAVQQSDDKPSTKMRLLFAKRKYQSAERSLDKTEVVTILPSFAEFENADQRYRNSVIHYGDLNGQFLRESMDMAENLVTDEFKTIETIQKMINAFTGGQGDLALALNRGSSQCSLMATHISPSTESNDFLVRVQNGISAQFGRPHLYKNFWFGLSDNGRLPIILFGQYNSNSNSKNTFLMGVLEVLVKHDPLLSLGPFDVQSRNKEDHEHISKFAHDLETCWDPQEIDGGSEVRRLLTTQPMCRKLLLHFLARMPEPLIRVSQVYSPQYSPVDESLQDLCDMCNGSSDSLYRRKMLFTVLCLLANSSKDGKSVQWNWWGQDDRDTFWSRTLTRMDSIAFLLPLWVHCFEYSETGVFKFVRARRRLLQESWQTWRHELDFLANISQPSL